MKSLHGFASSSTRACLTAFLFGALSLAACDQSNSVGKIGDTSAAGGSSAAERDGGFVPADGASASGAAGTAAGGTTAPAGGISGGAGKGGGTASGQAGAGGGGKAGALGSSAVDAGASAADGSSATGGSGGTKVDAAIDGHVCPPLTDVYCANYITDAYGCTVCASSGTGGVTGGTSGKGGAGGTTGAAGATGSGGTSGKVCKRMTNNDATCRSLNLPPQAYFCSEPTSPASTACVAYDGIDSGDAYCCPDQYLACPDGPPSNGTACTSSLACTYNSHPDPTCRTSATCANGTWQVRAPASRCSDALLPATCPASPTAGSDCSPRALSCAYADGKYCTCSNCTVEDPLCTASAPDTWRCWSSPGGDCPTYYPNLGSTCALPANTSCRYTCAANTICGAAGVWIDGGNRCPN